jgi:vancomycin permeability regulator SanA
MILKILNIKRALVLKNFILISVYFAIIIFIAFVKINFVTRTGEEFLFNKGEKFDAVVVLGAAVWKGNIPSPIYEGRLNKAYELLNKKFASKIFLTGSNAPYELSEAEVGKIYLEKKGVKPEQIELEEKTTSTIEQIHYIKREIMAKRKLNKLIVISDAFHLPRVIEIAKFLSVDFKVARSNLKIEFINNLWLRIREAVLLSIFWLFAV